MNSSDFKRSAGVLMHVSSLPNAYGIGSLGKESYAFVDFLAKAGFRYWQILPLVQTGYGDSPYQSVSCSSGNPYFIDLCTLHSDGLLTDAELADAKMPGGKVDYGWLYAKRYPILRKAFSRFDRTDGAFRTFLSEGKHDDYAAFMTIKTAFHGKCFSEWDEPLKLCRKDAVSAYIAERRDEYEFWQFLQFEFSRQWRALKAYANERGISIIGDIPLYVAYDSADVWANPDLFLLDEDRNPVEVAGVPPDYFSATGQLWGNPLYDWQKHRAQDYQWWINRIREATQIYDVIRIDHFRGLDRFYAVPATESTAVRGEWKDGPKSELFARIKAALGELHFIAEDLGTLDEGVYRLLRETAFPGMKVLLFAFDGSDDNPYLPKNIGENSVCYTGTHDNDTVVGYLNGLSDWDAVRFAQNVERAVYSRALRLPVWDRSQVADALEILALECDSRLAVLPMQDVLRLDNSARMNIPSVAGGNWSFRLQAMPEDCVAKRMRTLLATYKRL